MDKWQRLVGDLGNEKDLLLGRLTAEELESLCRQELGWIQERDGYIVACTFLFPTPAYNWYELGSVWVEASFRGQGLAANVFRSCGASVRGHKRKCFLITKHPKVAHLATDVGFLEADLASWNVVPWTASCGPCDRLPDSEKPNCPLRAVPAECRTYSSYYVYGIYKEKA